MDNLNLNKHISGQFNAELESIRTQVMTMGGDELDKLLAGKDPKE